MARGCKPMNIKNTLTARQMLYAERTLSYKYHVDAYLSVYRSNSSRRNATVNATRIYKMPAVQAYLERIKQERAKLAAIKAEMEREQCLAYLAKL